METIRLSFQREDGSEYVKDFTSVSEAREVAESVMSVELPGENVIDWVIFKKPAAGRYGRCGSVLDAMGGWPFPGDNEPFPGTVE